MSHEQIVIRDSIIFALGLLFVSAGLADAARLLTGLSWWGAAPVGMVFWGTAATLIYRRAQRKLDDLAEGTAS
jgi:hypothetical protein